MIMGAALVLVALAAVAALGIAGMARKPPPPAPSDAGPPPIALTGQLGVLEADYFSVGRTPVFLCGITLKDPRRRALVRTTLDLVYAGKNVTCMQSGGGTPCDGQTARTRQPNRERRDVPLVQCLDESGSDLAVELISKGLFCGTIDAPGYSGC